MANTYKNINTLIYRFGRRHTAVVILFFPVVITTVFVVILVNPENIINQFNHELLLSYTPDYFTMPATEAMFQKTAIISFFTFYFTIFLIFYANFLYIVVLYYRFFQHENRQTIINNFLLKIDHLIAFLKPIRLFIFSTFFMGFLFWAYPRFAPDNEVELFKMSIGMLGTCTLYFIGITTLIWFYCAKRYKHNLFNKTGAIVMK